MKYKILLLIFPLLYSCGNERTYSERNITDIKLSEVSHFEYEDGKLIRMSANDNYIFLSSVPDNTIQVFDYHGKHVRTIGKGGEAPWENGSIWSYGTDSTSYWIHDYPKMALKKYDIKTDTMLHTQRYITKHNVLFIKKNTFILPRFDSQEGIFYISLYDALKDSIMKSVNICELSKRFKKLPAYGDYTFQGNFCKNSNGQAVFYCLYNGSFFFIDKDFSNVTYHNDIRELPISEPVITNDWIKLNPDNAGILSGAMDKKYLYFLVPKYKGSKLDKKLKDLLIDVYDVSTKEYITSFELPKVNAKINLIAKTDKGFIIADYHGNVYIYNNSFIDEIEKIKLKHKQ